MIRILCADISGLEAEAYEKLYNQATRERQARADRYRRREDALRCVTADALLRFVLGGGVYTVEKTQEGKPHISGKPDFHFNLSHSGRWVVIAWGDSPVGVDVEKIREDTDIRMIASRFFTPEEQQYLRQTPEESRRRFFEIWTRKESCVKYWGTGLKRALNSFSVLQPEKALRFYTETLPGGYLLSLCCKEAADPITLLDARQLL